MDRRHVRTRLLVVEKKGHSDSSVDKYVIRIRSSCSTVKCRASYKHQAVSWTFSEETSPGDAAAKSISVGWSVNIADPNNVTPRTYSPNLGDRGDTGVAGENAPNGSKYQDGRLWVKYVLCVAKLRMPCKRNTRVDCVFYEKICKVV